MRSRLLSLTLGAALALTTAPMLAAPASAASPPAPVEIGAPAPESLRDTTSATTLYLVVGGGVSAESFVAESSGPVRSATQAMYTHGGTLSVYADDQFSNQAGSGLTPVPNSVFHAGTPLGTATFGPGSGNYQDQTLYTEPFDQTFDLVEGNTYWLVQKMTLGEPVVFSFESTLLSADGARWPYGFSLRLNSDDDPIGVDLTGTEGEDGWFTSPVTATYTCWGGVSDCPAAATISTQGASSPSGTVHDGDREFAWFHNLKVDTVAPSITGAATPRGSGFKVTWNCSDATSGVAVCPEPTFVSGVGEDTVASAVAKDNAGNTATGTVTGLVGTSHAPTITITGVTPNKTYAHGTKVTPTCTATSTRGDDPDQAQTTCSGTTTSKTNKNGSVTFTYTVTAVDLHSLGGATTRSVSWTIAAKPAPKATPKPTVVIKGLPKTTKNGHPVIDHRKTYDISFVFRDAKGKTVTGKPTWLHSIETNETATKGKPTKKAAVQFKKVKGVWVKTFTPSYGYKGEYRKFGVIAPDGTRHYVTVYVK